MAPAESNGNHGEGTKGEEPVEIISLNEQQAKKIVVEAFIYIVFLIVFSALLLVSRNNEEAYFFNNLVSDLYAEEEFPDIDIYKSFHDVATVDEYYEWLEGPFLQATFSPYNDHFLLQEGFVYGVSEIIGSVRFRQKRMGTDSCDVISDYKDEFGVCVAAYDSDHEDKTPYGGPDGDLFTWGDEDDLGHLNIYGRISRYDGEGFGVDIVGDNMTHAEDVVATMKDESYIDLQTRSLVIDLALYNGMSNLFAELVFLFEFPLTGGVVPSFFRFRALNLWRYSGSSGVAVAVLEIFTMLFVVYFTVENFKRLYECYKKREKLKEYLGRIGIDGYTVRVHLKTLNQALDKLPSQLDEDIDEARLALSDPANKAALTSILPAPIHLYFQPDYTVLDAVNLMLFYAVFCLRIASIQYGSEVDLSPDRSRHANINRIADIYMYEIYMQSFNAFICWFKLFKFVGISYRINQLMLVLKQGAVDILYFIIIFGFIFTAFAMFGHVAFGVDVAPFRTPGQSCLTLFRGVTEGTLFFEDLYRSNRIIGPLYYTFYYLLIFFILMNMFVAIVNICYEEVKHKRKKTRMGLGRVFFNYLKRSSKFLGFLFKKKDSKKDSKDAKGETDIPQFRVSMMKLEGEYGEAEIAGIRAMTSALDDALAADDDGGLSEEELASLFHKEFGMSLGTAKKTAREMMEDYDHSGDGRLDQREIEQIRQEIQHRTMAAADRQLSEAMLARAHHIEERIDAMLYYQVSAFKLLSEKVGAGRTEIMDEPEKVRRATVLLQSWVRGLQTRERIMCKLSAKLDAIRGRTESGDSDGSSLVAVVQAAKSLSDLEKSIGSPRPAAASAPSTRASRTVEGASAEVELQPVTALDDDDDFAGDDSFDGSDGNRQDSAGAGAGAGAGVVAGAGAVAPSRGSVASAVGSESAASGLRAAAVEVDIDGEDHPAATAATDGSRTRASLGSETRVPSADIPATTSTTSAPAMTMTPTVAPVSDPVPGESPSYLDGLDADTAAAAAVEDVVDDVADDVADGVGGAGGGVAGCDEQQPRQAKSPSKRGKKTRSRSPRRRKTTQGSTQHRGSSSRGRGRGGASHP